MAKKRIGIDALFTTSVPAAVPARAAEDSPRELAVDRLVPNPHQPRAHFEPAALQELTESVREHGVLQPILVRATGDGGEYEIVAGERRWRAARSAGLERVPVRVLDLKPGDRLAVAMVENLQRSDLNPLEEAEGYIELLRARLEGEEPFAALSGEEPRERVVRLLRALNNRTAGNTKDNVVLSLESAVTEVFARVGRITWQSFVAHRLPLLGLSEDVKAAVRAGLPYTKARAIARITAERIGGDEGRARRLRRDLIEQAITEGLSVRALQAEIERIAGARVAAAAGARRARPRSAAKRTELEAKLAGLRARLESIEPAIYGTARRQEIVEAIDRLLDAL